MIFRKLREDLAVFGGDFGFGEAAFGFGGATLTFTRRRLTIFISDKVLTFPQGSSFRHSPE
jgi:hypothetical protein